MSSKDFCESGKHVYREIDIVQSAFAGEEVHVLWIVVACKNCDSKFLRQVDKPLP